MTTITTPFAIIREMDADELLAYINDLSNDSELVRLAKKQYYQMTGQSVNTNTVAA